MLHAFAVWCDWRVCFQLYALKSWLTSVSTGPALSQAFYVPPQSGGGPGEHQGTSWKAP